MFFSLSGIHFLLHCRLLLVSRGLRSNQFREVLAKITGNMLLALPEKLVYLTSKVSEGFSS